MRNTIFFKVFGSILLLIIVLAGVIGFFSYNAFRSFHLDTLAGNLENQGYSIKDQIFPLLISDNVEMLDAYVKEIGKTIQTRITVIAENGKVMADSNEDPAVMDDHKFRPEIIKAFTGEIGRSQRFSRTVKENMLYVGIPLEMEGRVSHVLRLSLFARDINYLLTGMKGRMLRMVGLICLLALIAAGLITRSFSQPIRELYRASRRVASGDFNSKVYIKRKGEFKELGDSFNFMSDQVNRLFSELSAQKDELGHILESIDEGLLTLDKEGRISLWNQNFTHMMDTEDSIKERHYWEVIREANFGELIQMVMREKKSGTSEIMIKGKIFLCSARAMTAREEIVVTFLDVTESRNIEKMKKDFILNISHELRTPLTAIKGYLETLEEDLKADQRKYLVPVLRNTDRLINIVNDLLLLSELEAEEIKIKFEEIDLRGLIENVLKIFESRAGEKKLKIATEIDENLPAVFGDAFRLEQIFINLIDNAIKYTETGKITIEAKKVKNQLVISIQDSGIGIPQNDVPRIFERFYVVDKSRSRSGGGTGLGLSIVKHIAIQHGGNVTVESTSGVGTTFTVYLPLKP